MFERFTTQAREVVVRARHEARQLSHPQIGTEHLLLAMLDDTAGIAYSVLHTAGLNRDEVRAAVIQLHGAQPLGGDDAAALKAIGIDLDAVRARIEEAFGPGALRPPPPEPRGGRLLRSSRLGGNFSFRAKKTLELALRESLRLRDNYLGSEHILLGLLREGGGRAATILTDAGLSLDDLRRQTLSARGKAA